MSCTRLAGNAGPKNAPKSRLLVSFVLLLRFDKKCFTRLCFKNLFVRLSVCLCVSARSVVNIQHRLFGCVFLVCCHHLRKVNKSLVRSFRCFFSTICLLFDVPQYSNRFDYIKDIRPEVYFNNQKIIAYHL